MLRLAIVLGLTAVAACGSARPRLPLVTTGERSGYVKTGRYDEAVSLCRDFARAYDGVTCEELGRTLQDRPIVGVRVSRGRGRPVMYLQGGVHAGEIDGKDAGFWFLRDLLDGKVAPGALDVVDVLFVPVINPDGHERFGPNHRPNQRGPEEVGFRTNGTRINVNRDFMKADTREAQTVLAIYRRFNPIVFVDMHATDGAKFEHDIAVLVGPVAARADQLDETAHALSDQLQARLSALGHLPLSFYPSFEKADDPMSGFAIGEAPARFSQIYAATRSRLGILVETHSWRPYRERVTSTYHLLQALFERATSDIARWTAASDAAARADRTLTELVLGWDNGPHVTQIDFRGYAFEQVPSDISGGTWTRYDETKPQIWKVPLKDELVAKVTTRVPRAGYIIDGGFAAQLTPILDAHGITYERIEPRRIIVEAFRATKATFQPPFEGRTRVTVEGAWAPETRMLDRGAVFVALARQAAPRVAVHLLDPQGPDSFVQWGFVSSVFEQKEYMESYVAEEQARQLLAANPALRAELDAALAADPELAKSPERRLEWFYRRTPAWDERTNLVPIYRVDALTGN